MDTFWCHFFDGYFTNYSFKSDCHQSETRAVCFSLDVERTMIFFQGDSEEKELLGEIVYFILMERIVIVWLFKEDFFFKIRLRVTDKFLGLPILLLLLRFLHAPIAFSHQNVPHLFSFLR